MKKQTLYKIEVRFLIRCKSEIARLNSTDDPNIVSVDTFTSVRIEDITIVYEFLLMFTISSIKQEEK
jgi:hypothetical protein